MNLQMVKGALELAVMAAKDTRPANLDGQKELFSEQEKMMELFEIGNMMLILHDYIVAEQKFLTGEPE